MPSIEARYLGLKTLDGVALDPDTPIYPLCETLPMGFSWSSYVCQCFMLDLCKVAQLPDTHSLSADREPPPWVAGTFGLATDDIMVPSRGGSDVATGLPGSVLGHDVIALCGR